jgi:hypothetical protein
MRLPTSLVVTLALCAFGGAQGATLTWPGPSPCNATLQGCINGAESGDIVEVASNGPIDENLQINNKSLTLRNARGFAPRLADGRHITGGSSGAGELNVTVRGLTLRDGRVQFFRSGSGNGTFRFERLVLLGTSNDANVQIRVTGSNTGSLDVHVIHNQVEAGSDFITSPGIDVQSRGPTSSVRIAYNRVSAPRGSASNGIRAFTEIGGSLNLVAFANELHGHLGQGAIRVSALAAPVVADVINNVVVGARSAGSSDATDGITLIVGEQTMSAFVYNNTVVDTGGGIALFRASGSSQNFGGTVRNNLVAFNQNGLRMLAGTDSVSNGFNLVHGNVSNNFTPGTGTVTANPRLRSLLDPRLTVASPAINAGDTNNLHFNLSFIGWPFVDADGLRRFVGDGPQAVDIGAYEFGDRTFLARSPPTALNNFIASHPSLDGQPAARAHLSKVFNPFGVPSVNNPNPFGFWYFSGTWRPFNQNLATMPTGAAFNVFVPGPPGVEGASYAHVATAGNISGHVTTLDHPYLNTRSDAIVIVTPNWNNGVYVNHNIAAGYACFGAPGPDCWAILNQDFGAMPVNASFNVYAQDPSHNAFVHSAAIGNTSGNATYLDHPLLNGQRCARLYATQKLGTVNDRQFDLFYDAGVQRWTIFNQGGAMPAGAEFFVLVDAASGGPCTTTLFGDGFEATTP